MEEIEPQEQSMQNESSELSFKLESKVCEKLDHKYGKILYFPISFEETNSKLKKHGFHIGDRVIVTVKLKKKAVEKV